MDLNNNHERQEYTSQLPIGANSLIYMAEYICSKDCFWANY